MTKRFFLLRLFVVSVALTTSLQSAIQPANPDLSPEARKMLAYFESIQGKKSLTGISDSGGWHSFYEWSGRMPALYDVDCFSWAKPRFGPEYCKKVQIAINTTKYWWEERGGVPIMHYHWGKPGEPEGVAWIKEKTFIKGTGPMDMDKLITPGTEEHSAAMNDLKRVADYLDQLNKAHVPVLWRPFHEIDGGWFWWTDNAKPENSAAAYRMMFGYFVKERKLNNLIWVFATANHAGGFKPAKGKPNEAAKLADEIAWRKRFYPGAEYVDIAGMDIYPNASDGIGDPQEDSYKKAYAIMEGVAPGKMHPICESTGLVNPKKLAQDAPNWIYVEPWFAGNKKNQPDWIRLCANDSRYITMDQLPALGSHNVAPDVRLIQPVDGADIGASVQLTAVAGDRNGNLKGVTFYLLPGVWKDRTMSDAMVDTNDILSKATKLGEAKQTSGDRYSFIWSNIKPDFYDLVAVASDTEGKQTISSVVRVAAGIKDLARNKTATSSSGPQSNPGNAVDGDLITSWSSEGEADQWIALDLGSEETVGAVTLSWWRYYAQAYVLQVSNDGTQWKEVFSQPKKTGKTGDTDLIRFTPVKTRYIRLLCQKSTSNNGGHYCLFEFRVFQSLPLTTPSTPAR